MNSRHPVYAALLDIGKDAVHKLDAHPVGGSLVRGTLPASDYVAYLTQVVQQVRESGPMLHAASRRLERQGRHRLAALFSAKSGEETGHDEWALQDLEALGVSRVTVEAADWSPAVDAYLAWTAYSVEQAPVAVLGVAWILEWFGYARAGRAAENLVAHGGIPHIDSAVRFLRGHGDADHGHVQVLAAALGEVTDPGEAAIVQLSASVTATLYLSFFDPRSDDGSGFSPRRPGAFPRGAHAPRG